MDQGGSGDPPDAVATRSCHLWGCPRPEFSNRSGAAARDRGRTTRRVHTVARGHTGRLSCPSHILRPPELARVVWRHSPPGTAISAIMLIQWSRLPRRNEARCYGRIARSGAGGKHRGALILRKKGRMDSVSQVVWGLVIVFALVVVNAFFVAAEYALVRVRRTRMEALAAQGSALATVVVHCLDHLSRYIAGVQVGITLAGLASGCFGEPVLAALLASLFAPLVPASLVGPEGSSALTTGLALLVISYLLVVLSELASKAITLH